jgi:hypothetical protein
MRIVRKATPSTERYAFPLAEAAGMKTLMLALNRFFVKNSVL